MTTMVPASKYYFSFLSYSDIIWKEYTKMKKQLVPGQLDILSPNKTDRHDIAEILLKVALNTITPNPYFYP
jgi:hypothetical protein